MATIVTYDMMPVTDRLVRIDKAINETAIPKPPINNHSLRPRVSITRTAQAVIKTLTVPRPTVPISEALSPMPMVLKIVGA